jgi:uncharacterized protein (DUF2237 family)
MSAEIEIVGGAGDYEAAAIVAAIQTIFFEEDAKAKQLTSTSRWRIELEGFEPGRRWGVAQPPASPDGS